VARLTKSEQKKAAKRASKKNRSVVGATRNSAEEQEQAREPSVWLNRLLVVCASLVVVAAGTKAYSTVEKIPVQRISVTGELEHTQAEAVQAMVQSSLRDSFLKVDLELMRDELQGLPWIYQANVRRKWPNALEIHVVEQLPIARWGSDGFLNHQGGVFHSAKEGDWSSLPQLKGPEGTAVALMAKYQRLLEILAPVDLKVSELSVDERGQVEVVLAPDVRLLLGGTEFLERMHRFVSIYRRELAAKMAKIERIDLRYQQGVAVGFIEETLEETSQVARI